MSDSPVASFPVSDLSSAPPPADAPFLTLGPEMVRAILVLLGLRLPDPQSTEEARGLRLFLQDWLEEVR